MSITVNADFFEAIDTQEKAYWLGFIFGDGYISEKAPWTVILTSVDQEHILRFANTVHYTGNIAKAKGGYEGSKEQARLTICRKKMCQDIRKYGRKSNNDGIPQLASHLMPHYIRGYFDADGSVFLANTTASTNKKKYAYLNAQIIGNIPFIHQLKELFKGLGITSTIKASKSESMIYLCIAGGHNMRKLHQYMYADSTVSLPRKEQKFSHLYEGPTARQLAERNNR